jgi:hypothetical protein
LDVKLLGNFIAFDACVSQQQYQLNSDMFSQLHKDCWRSQTVLEFIWQLSNAVIAA